MTRKHNTQHAPSLTQLSADTRAAYYQAHHDAREEARTTFKIARYAAGRASVFADWGNGRCNVLIQRYHPPGAAWWPSIEADSVTALISETCRELDCARAALTQRRTYPADKALARRCISRARWLRIALADCTA
jgi:hypothetical protein